MASDSGLYRGGQYSILKGGSGGGKVSGAGIDTSGDRQYYRTGMYDMLKNGSHGVLHGRTKKGKPHAAKTHHGRRGMHGNKDTLARGAAHDVWGNRDRMRGQR